MILKWKKKAEFHTTLFDSTVVKLSFGVGGVAPGPVLIPIRITTVVLCQIGLRMRPWVYPGKSHRSFSKCKHFINVTNKWGEHIVFTFSLFVSFLFALYLLEILPPYYLRNHPTHPPMHPSSINCRGGCWSLSRW